MDFKRLDESAEHPAYKGDGATPEEADLATAAALLAAVGTPVVRAIRARDVKRLWGRRMILAHCRVIADDPAADVEARIVCRATYDNLMNDLFADLDPAGPDAGEIAAYLDRLQAAGVLSEQDRADTLALAMVAVPLLAEIGCPELVGQEATAVAAEIAEARRQREALGDE